ACLAVGELFTFAARMTVWLEHVPEVDLAVRLGDTERKHRQDSRRRGHAKWGWLRHDYPPCRVPNIGRLPVAARSWSDPARRIKCCSRERTRRAIRPNHCRTGARPCVLGEGPKESSDATPCRIPRGMARREGHAARPREGTDEGARRARCRTTRPAVGRDR